MINNYLEPSVVIPADRNFAIKLQTIDAQKTDPGVPLTRMAIKLANFYLKTLLLSRQTHPSKVALLFEVEDADDAAVAVKDILVSSHIAVETACFWIHRRKSSFDKQLVETTRVHAENIANVDAAIVLQPGPIRPEAIRALLVQTEGRLNPACPIIVLTSWCSPDLIDEVEQLIPHQFNDRVDIGYVSEGKSSAESVLYNSTRFSSSQRQGFPSGWDKNDFYPRIVQLAIERKMSRDRGASPPLTL